jgi:hypothetical protein
MNLTPDVYDRTMKEGVKVNCDFTLERGAKVIRTLVLDSNSGEIRTVTIPPSPHFSPPLLSSNRIPPQRDVTTVTLYEAVAQSLAAIRGLSL